MLAAFAGFAAVAVVLGQVEVPHGWTVWGALLVTGDLRERARVSRPDLGAARTTATQTALAFAMEPVFAGFSGSGSRATGWGRWAGPAAR